MVPEIGSRFDDVVRRALAKRPDDRYPSAGDLGRAAIAAAHDRPVDEPERSVASGEAASPGQAVTTVLLRSDAPTAGSPDELTPDERIDDRTSPTERFSTEATLERLAPHVVSRSPVPRARVMPPGRDVTSCQPPRPRVERRDLSRGGALRAQRSAGGGARATRPRSRRIWRALLVPIAAATLVAVVALEQGTLGDGSAGGAGGKLLLAAGTVTGRDAGGYNIGRGCSDDPGSSLPGCRDAPTMPRGGTKGTCAGGITIEHKRRHVALPYGRSRRLGRTCTDSRPRSQQCPAGGRDRLPAWTHSRHRGRDASRRA